MNLILNGPRSWWTAGYKWRMQEGRGVSRRGRPLRIPPGGVLSPDPESEPRPQNYQPLNKPHLYRDFAKLGEDVFQQRRLVPTDIPSRELIQQITEFADEYGPPWLMNWPRSRPPGLMPTAEQIRHEARILHVCIRITDSQPQIASDVMELIEATNTKEALRWVGAQSVERLDDVAITPVFDLTDPGQVRTGYVYRSLLGAIWLQYLMSMAGRRERVCDFPPCGGVIQEPRANQRFCRVSCQDANKKARKRARRRSP